MNEERGLKGPGSYEKYNKISVLCQKKYFQLFKCQISLLLIIAFLSLLPPSSESKWEIIKHSLELFLIILVFLEMIVQFNANYMKGWQNARYLAESILSNAWLFVWKYESFNDMQNYEHKFIDMVESLEKEVELKSFLSLVPNQEDEISKWMEDFRKNDLQEKKDHYVKYRLDEQINWYSKKAFINQNKSKSWFIVGLLLMGLGAVLTIFVIIGVLPNLQFLGFFTTAAVSVFSWSQARRNDELKITYSVSAQELSRFKAKMKITSNENELIELVANIEKAISREHKLWLAKV